MLDPIAVKGVVGQHRTLGVDTPEGHFFGRGSSLDKRRGNTLSYNATEVPVVQLCKMKEYAPQVGGMTLEFLST